MARRQAGPFSIISTSPEFRAPAFVSPVLASMMCAILAISDSERPVGFNPAIRIATERRALAAAVIVAAFRHSLIGEPGVAA
jgi:hypothetical protein